jgi:hypothetical protein
MRTLCVIRTHSRSCVPYARCMRIALTAAALAITFSPLAVSADQTATMSGTIKYVTSAPPRLGIEVNRRTTDFIMDPSFTNILKADGTQVGRDQLKVGSSVHVIYLKSTLLGSSRVTEVDIVSTGGTPLPIPLH